MSTDLYFVEYEYSHFFWWNYEPQFDFSTICTSGWLFFIKYAEFQGKDTRFLYAFLKNASISYIENKARSIAISYYKCIFSELLNDMQKLLV